MTAAVTSPDLTPREREVLEAVSEHRTNAEIAARLFLSVRTVESHVASLLRKTGASSRRELAVLATPGTAADIVPLTPFIGRREEQDALARAVRSHRLVTALGPGGVGKTRLALAVAARERDGPGDLGLRQRGTQRLLPGDRAQNERESHQQ